MEIDIEIDSLTDCLIDRSTGEKFDTVYRLISKTITKDDAQKLMKAGWKFDWSVPHSEGYEIYELMVKGSNEIQGLIALKHFRDQLFTFVDLVESNPNNIGQSGKFEGVGAHLFAIACKLSFEVGNEGYVQFISKTNLIEHYKKILGAQLIGNQSMFLDTTAAYNLVKKYFSEESK